MTVDGTHASFFSGVGGLDLGLERAGWRTVSFSEIDPYASAVLAERWPGIPNLGDIVELARASAPVPDGLDQPDPRGRNGYEREQRPHADAELWTGGFPCQDLSVAGKRRGFAGERSSLAFAFLDLVERHRPPAILLENVPGLLSSHRGRDMAVLLGRMAELGYGVAYRILDARHFGVPQRRRRVFILGLRSGPDDPSGRAAAERAAAVLSVGSRCPRHPATGGEAGSGAAGGARPGVDIARAVTGTSGKRHDDDTDTLIAASETGTGWWNRDTDAAQGLRADPGGTPSHVVVSPSPDPGGVRAADGLAGRLDDRLMGSLREHVRPGSNTDYTVIQEQAATLNSGGNDGGFRTEPGEHLVAFVKQGREHHDDGETWGPGDVSPVVDSIGHGPRTATAVLGSDSGDDPLLPLGLDSHRYRCCGNGVVAPVSEWLGRRLMAAIA